MHKYLHPRFYIDWVSFILIVTISIISLFTILSATQTITITYSIWLKKQGLGVAMGIIFYWIFSSFNPHTLLRWGYFAFFGTIALLCFTLIKGSIGMGAQRWINLIFFKLQPSELAKPLFPAFFSYYFFTHSPRKKMKDFIFPLIMLGITFILVAKQPDLGTALIILFTGLILFWFAGLPRSFYLGSMTFILLSAPLLWHCLKPYQRKRINSFLSLEDHQHGQYQAEQSKIAIGSGGLLGKGIFHGTQNRLKFLPENHTDFIFAVICEEVGFMGAILTLFFYFILFFRLYYIINHIEKSHQALLAIGLTLPIILSTIINISMVLGLLPIVGIPLPFLSYGLNNLLTSFASLGWIQAIYREH